ncbi:hypothetical protein [Helicobacter sp. 12S02232-10]|uniref:hypothetical protein n=1 Tax=Helicobacter sp. 12S02232-10 TaxID=1476197 RepID=UPI0015DDC53D|nr:hypothetical protein [Helicobacter sp. 12S02232-10]
MNPSNLSDLRALETRIALTKEEFIALANYGIELQNELEAKADLEAKIELTRGDDNE